MSLCFAAITLKAKLGNRACTRSFAAEIVLGTNVAVITWCCIERVLTAALWVARIVGARVVIIAVSSAAATTDLVNAGFTHSARIAIVARCALIYTAEFTPVLGEVAYNHLAGLDRDLTDAISIGLAYLRRAWLGVI